MSAATQAAALSAYVDVLYCQPFPDTLLVVPEALPGIRDPAVRALAWDRHVVNIFTTSVVDYTEVRGDAKPEAETRASRPRADESGRPATLARRQTLRVVGKALHAKLAFLLPFLGPVVADRTQDARDQRYLSAASCARHAAAGEFPLELSSRGVTRESLLVADCVLDALGPEWTPRQICGEGSALAFVPADDPPRVCCRGVGCITTQVIRGGGVVPAPRARCPRCDCAFHLLCGFAHVSKKMQCPGCAGVLWTVPPPPTRAASPVFHGRGGFHPGAASFGGNAVGNAVGNA